MQCYIMGKKDEMAIWSTWALGSHREEKFKAILPIPRIDSGQPKPPVTKKPPPSAQVKSEHSMHCHSNKVLQHFFFFF